MWRHRSQDRYGASQLAADGYIADNVKRFNVLRLTVHLTSDQLIRRQFGRSNGRRAV